MNTKKLETARERYETKRKIKPVSFNTETEADLLEYANSLDFSEWTKQKLKQEMDIQSPEE